jgi:hypothetical protein
MGEPAHHLQDVEELMPGASDGRILPYCGKFNQVLVTLDRRILRSAHLRGLLTEYGVGAFFVQSHRRKETPAPWLIFKSLVRNWEEMRRLAQESKRPFAKLVKPKGAIEDIGRSRRR